MTTGRRHRPWPRCRRCYGLALDLGSARTRAWIAGRGTLLDVPTVAVPGAGKECPPPGTARMLDRLLGHRMPRPLRPLVAVTAPVLDGVAYRERARTAVAVLRPRAVLTVPTARAIALAADIGAHGTEVVLLLDGAVLDARRSDLGTAELSIGGGADASAEVGAGVTAMVAAMLREDRSPRTADALARGILLAGGGALHPGLVRPIVGGLQAPLRTVPAPHTAAVRGAAKILRAAHAHPSTGGAEPAGPHRGAR
ncbi:rod shape-determining protein [Streptomyces sp. LP11]|uniref:Rod shape-determining protein n=1 Tax=Streptomyces pyxinicus TaxID=2970331 RepID=A0ABT2AV11_9ACTN|nr:rod shape-determining protein [Streptomyces sp. LP11]MCS0600096.1 rod shape-determining protein [Streptomyces sp. LP11]